MAAAELAKRMQCFHHPRSLSPARPRAGGECNHRDFAIFQSRYPPIPQRIIKRSCVSGIG